VTELRAAALESPAALDAIRRESGADLVAGDALGVFPDAWAGLAAGPLAQLRGNAGDIARLARIDVGLGRAVPAAQAMPLYVRDRVALTIDERRQQAVA